MADCQTIVELTPPSVVEADVTAVVVEAEVQAPVVVEVDITATVEVVEIAPVVVEVVEVFAAPPPTIGAPDTMVAGEDLDFGELVTVSTTGEAILAEAGWLSGLWDAIGTVKTTGTTLTGALVEVGTDAVRAANMLFDVIPVPADNGRLVFLSPTPGRATVTPPGSGSMLFVLGTLQGGDGLNPTPVVRFRPQIIGRHV